MAKNKQDQALDDITQILEVTKEIGNTLATHGEAISNVKEGLDKIEKCVNENVGILHQRINEVDRNQIVTETNLENHLKHGTATRPTVKNGNGESAKKFWIGVMSIVLIVVITAYVIVDKVLTK